MPSTRITFYGGVHEIGGNKFLVEDRGTRVFLDFGMQMAKVNHYFAEFLKPRICNGMGDLFEFMMLPRLRGLYRRDYSKHMGFDGNEDTEFHAVLLTHAHIDHGAYIHYLRPDIPVYCSEATKLIMQTLQDTGSTEDYITCREHFLLHKNRKGEMVRSSGVNYSIPRKISTFESSKKFSIDSIEVEPLPVDHSIPGVCGFILHTSNSSIGYTGDLRLHGRRSFETEKFIERCHNSDLDVLLCEGTRVNEELSKMESDVEKDVTYFANQTQKLVVCTYPERDLDRFLSFYHAAKESGRDLVIGMKQAYLLTLFQKIEVLKNVYPRPDDKIIKVYIPRRSWGLICKDINEWSRKQLLEDYDGWEVQFLDYANRVDCRDVSSHQNELIFYCNDFHLQELIDIRPDEKSGYIRSSTEPFDDEMRFDEIRAKRWLAHFGLLTNEQAQWHHTHVSGHGSGDQIKRIIEVAAPKCVIPIHTEHEEYHKKWHNNVVEVTTNSTIELS